MSNKELVTRENILNAARKEFLEKGYQGAWLRDIAKNAGVTTGALYGYFKNKEELFAAIVSDCYYEIQSRYQSILESFQQLNCEQQQKNMEKIAAKGMLQLVDYMYEHYEEFKIILCCSQDTPFTDLANDMALLDEAATDKFVEECAKAGKSVKRMLPRLEHILSTGFFTMAFELIIHDVPRQEADEYIVSLLHFYTLGCSGIMGF